MKKIYLVMLFLLIISNSVLALIGTVIRTEGSVSVVRMYDEKKEKEAISEGSIVIEGDRVITEVNASCDIEWADKVYSRIGESTEVELKEITKNKSKLFKIEKVNIQLKLLKGQLRCKLRKLNLRKESFKVTTPAAVVAVRGTDFLTSHSTSTKNTNVSVMAGLVSVTNIVTGKITNVTAGNSLNVAKGSESSEPAKMNFDSRGLSQPKTNNKRASVIEKIITPAVNSNQHIETNIVPQETMLNIKGTF